MTKQPRTCPQCGERYTARAHRPGHRASLCPPCRSERYYRRMTEMRRRSQGYIVHPPDTATLIEQAIARGWPTSRIMERIGVTYETVTEVRRCMDAAAGATA